MFSLINMDSDGSGLYYPHEMTNENQKNIYIDAIGNKGNSARSKRFLNHVHFFAVLHQVKEGTWGSLNKLVYLAEQDCKYENETAQMLTMWCKQPEGDSVWKLRHLPLSTITMHPWRMWMAGMMESMLLEMLLRKEEEVNCAFLWGNGWGRIWVTILSSQVMMDL